MSPSATIRGGPSSCLELLRRMIGFNTVNRTAEGVPFVEGQLAEFLESLAARWGLQTARLTVDNVGFNLLVTHPTDSSRPWLLFDSHLDTVDVQGMTIEPFEGKVADGRIFGRGACDTKGTGAAMLWALKEAVAERRLEVNVALLYTIDEEAGRSGVRAFVDHHLEGLGWRPAGVVVGEPTSLRMVTAHNGTVRWRIRTQGVAAHSSDPPQGRSAIRSMTIVMDALERQYIPTLDASHPLVGKAQCSVNLIRGGTLINVIPESCEIWLDRRTVPGEDGRAVAGAVESILERVRQQHTDLEVVQDPPTIEPALSPDLNREFASRIGRVLDSLDMASEAVGAKYGTHASSFASAGLPAIVLGPGQIAQAHSAQEYLTLDDLQRGVEVYRKLMLQPAAAWI